MEDRLKFHDNKRLKRAREIRKKNKRKKRLWLGGLFIIVLISGVYQMDKNGMFEAFFDTRVAYSGSREYPETEGTVISRRDIPAMAQLLINHPYKFGATDLNKGIPVGPLDAAGFVDWVYFNLSGKVLSGRATGAGTATTRIWYASEPVMEPDLKVGDIGFYEVPDGNRVNHVGIYIGEIDGDKVFIHAGGINYRAEGLPDGRVVISFNNTLRMNNRDLEGNKFSPSAESTRFIYYRRPKLDIAD
jgi:hypothetical protein